MSAIGRRAAFTAALLGLMLAALFLRRPFQTSAAVWNRLGVPGESAKGSVAAPNSPGTSPDSAPGAGSSPPAVVPPLRRLLHVHDRAGRPLRATVKAMVSWDHFKTFQILDLASDDHGSAELSMDPSTWVILDIRAPGHRGQRGSPQTWCELPDEPTEVELDASTPIEVRPVSISGDPLATLRIRFSPEWPSGDFAGIAATRMNIVDEDLLTDAQGLGTATSLRPGPYLLSFPDHPQWPTLRVSAEDLSSPSLQVRLHWQTGR